MGKQNQITEFFSRPWIIKSKLYIGLDEKYLYDWRRIGWKVN